MFRTFRVRLLFWFLVFISSSFVIIALSLTYLQKREQIFAKSESIDQAYLILLKSVEAQQDFFSYETKNGNYFVTGNSEYLKKYERLLDSTLNTLNSSYFTEEKNIQQDVDLQKSAILEVDSLFVDLTRKIKVRGFKDYNLEGDMRKNAHWLEGSPHISREKVLSLRRHEKDYIIRHDSQYIDKLTAAVDKIEAHLKRTSSIPLANRDSVLFHLKSYEDKFLQLVELDREIGIKDNTGLKKALDLHIRSLESGFEGLVQHSRKWARDEFDSLTFYFALTAIVLVVISIIISAFIANRITQPLRELTTHITQFVDSNFTLENQHPLVKSKDEIGSLTHNFSILKNEVISQMKFFKQRVEERTKELAESNKKLARISEANSRFVPRAFLQNLGKESIEEVALGDHVQREMTVVFTDIRNFTQISEELSPEENFELVNQYLNGIVPIIQKHGGFIDKFIGDSVMALFPNYPDNAIKALAEFDHFMDQFNATVIKSMNMAPMKIGSGVHTGSMILGTIGHSNRLETTVISDAVNTAARVEGLTKHYDTPVVITKSTLLKLENKDEFHFRFLDKVKVKGKSKTLSVYQFLPPHEKLKISYIDRYEEAIALFKDNQFTEAQSIFFELYERNPNDKAAKRFVTKCEDSIQGLSSGWEATQMTKK